MKVFWRVPVCLLLLAALSSVTCQDSPVDGSVGGSVLLPCIFTGPPPNQINVFWRDKDNNAVFNIEKGSPSSSHQNQRYQGRVFNVSDDFSNGNFSIQMKNLQINDSGTYVCNIVPGHKRRVQLRVLEEVRTTLAPKTAGSSAGAAGTSILHVVLLAAVLLGC